MPRTVRMRSAPILRRRLLMCISSVAVSTGSSSGARRWAMRPLATTAPGSRASSTSSWNSRRVSVSGSPARRTAWPRGSMTRSPSCQASWACRALRRTTAWMRESSSEIANGFMTKSSAPPSRPARRSSSAVRAVMTMTGVVASARRQRDSRSKPLPSGRLKSSSTQSAATSASCGGASSTRRSHSQLKPCWRKAACRLRPRSRSSSMSRRCMADDCRGANLNDGQKVPPAARCREGPGRSLRSAVRCRGARFFGGRRCRL
mmetsp:Transcript_37545/g.87665  ORF Transcript_37545/g.87665 Transcript_37545/m.87665 type:complete len:261 (+) Transcript_37545:1258-2040(+)